jgi:hypothetical protein
MRSWNWLLAMPALLASTPAFADTTFAITPGVRLGYTFEHGLTMGVEVSALFSPEAYGQYDILDAREPHWGAVAGVDWIYGEEELVRIGVGAEVTYYFGAVSLGPTLVLGENGVRFGAEATASVAIGFPTHDFNCADFAVGPLLAGYYRLAFLGDVALMHDAGGLLKVFFVRGNVFCQS